MLKRVRIDQPVLMIKLLLQSLCLPVNNDCVHLQNEVDRLNQKCPNNSICKHAVTAKQRDNIAV